MRRLHRKRREIFPCAFCLPVKVKRNERFNFATSSLIRKDEKIMQERKAADPLLTGLLLLMRFYGSRRETYSAVIAPVGQAPSQAPQPTHASETLCAIINSPFYLRARSMYEESCMARLCMSLRKSYPCLHFNKAGEKRQD